MKTIIEQERIEALAKCLEIDYEEAEQLIKDGDYLVLTDEEADDYAKEYIKDSAWAFRSEFLASFTGLPEEMFKTVQDKCESSNEAILRTIEKTGGIDSFVEEAISADGRGHFISSYDGEEIEEGDYFIYRLN